MRCCFAIETLSKLGIPSVSFFVFIRVISWIGCYAATKAIHEITRMNTNEVPRQIRVLKESLSKEGMSFCNKERLPGFLGPTLIAELHSVATALRDSSH